MTRPRRAVPVPKRRCRNCANVVPKARWETGRDYCKNEECVKACAPARTYIGVAVAKSIPQILPAETINPDIAKSGHRRS